MDDSSPPVAFILLLCTLGDIGSAASADTPPRPGSWEVSDNQGRVCMLLSFSAQISVHEKTAGHENRVLNILPSYNSKTSCLTPYREVIFAPSSGTSYPKLQLTFYLDPIKQVYTMAKVVAQWYDASLDEPFTEQRISDNFLSASVAVENSYYCEDEMTVDLDGGDASVHMWNMHLQPFSDESGGVYGPKQNCDSGAWIIAACTLIGVGVFMVFAGMGVYVLKRRRRNDYAHLQGGGYPQHDSIAQPSTSIS
ncbi:uncharacterized protein LOC110986988 [Acanthaster planci]|uniref:Lysosome-associated membrane glycoprotein 5 n=1 Tax=Acanthaster planci TaxID=133434 RepID=A0A8B7ZJ60_ACAPL|nr:uncharacterized protein LOC110986988 [Acanthaster planci]